MVAEGVDEASLVRLVDGVAVSELLCVAVWVTEDVGVKLPLELEVILEESETLGVMEALAPLVTELVGVEDSDDEQDSLIDDVDEGVTLAVGDRVALDVGVALVVGDTDIELESEPVEEGLAPADKVGVGLLVIDFERLSVVVGVAVGVPVGDAVPDAVPVTETTPLPLECALFIEENSGVVESSALRKGDWE